MRRLRQGIGPAHALVGLLLLAGLALRLWHNDYGLPYVYNVDEGSHFTSRAVAMFSGDFNPGYFQNPSGYTYLVHVFLWLRGFGDVVEQFKQDPTEIYQAARSLAAVICIAGGAAVFAVAKRVWGVREGVVAAAILTFAFLPVTYSRIAVTDVGTLLPVALAVYGALRAHETGERRWFCLAGAAAGLAIGFKYTAGLVLLPVLLAAALRLRGGAAAALAGAALAIGCAVVAFFVTTPWFFFDLDTARRQIEAQATTAGDFPKLGQRQDSGLVYYLESLTWGLGWAGALAALAGLAIEARRDLRRAALLAVFPLALVAYLSLQSRYFGRWLLPAYPVLAMLGAVALVRASELVTRPRAAMAVLATLTAAVLAQPLAADVRTGRLLGRSDTRQLAREYLVERFPPRLRVVVEPAVPARWYRLNRPGRKAPLSRKQFVRGFVKDIQESRIDYAATLRPGTIERYRELGFCVVATMSVIRGRAENDRVEGALAYYERLERESELLTAFSPYEQGGGTPRFHFDLSYNHYPTAFERPGPLVRIYRLDDCRQRYGPLPRGAGTPAS
ncbi:MAG TPA: glycosyltransferase family 39 protein [Thermoleophilaceae bacterium]|nr:glycosyltransferase family 39 protein [Thermoleophilaceae bacterium]